VKREMKASYFPVFILAACNESKVTVSYNYR